MRIALFTMGGRGDTQPFVALAVRLRQEGHRVTLAARPDFADLAADYGVEFAPLGHPYQPFITGQPNPRRLAGAISSINCAMDSRNGGIFLTTSTRMPGARHRAQTQCSTNIAGSPATASRKNLAFLALLLCSFP